MGRGGAAAPPAPRGPRRLPAAHAGRYPEHGHRPWRPVPECLVRLRGGYVALVFDRIHTTRPTTDTNAITRNRVLRIGASPPGPSLNRSVNLRALAGCPMGRRARSRGVVRPISLPLLPGTLGSEGEGGRDE